jgi:hypothetical protein
MEPVVCKGGDLPLMPFSLCTSGHASFALRRCCIDDNGCTREKFSVWTDTEGFGKPQTTMPIYEISIDQGSRDILLVGGGSFEVMVKISRPSAAIAAVCLLPEETHDVMHWEWAPKWTTQATHAVFDHSKSSASAAILHVECRHAERAAPLKDTCFVISRRSEQVCDAPFLSIFRSEIRPTAWHQNAMCANSEECS